MKESLYRREKGVEYIGMQMITSHISSNQCRENPAQNEAETCPLIVTPNGVFGVRNPDGVSKQMPLGFLLEDSSK